MSDNEYSYVQTEQYQQLNKEITELGEQYGYDTPEYCERVDEVLKDGLMAADFTVVEETHDELVVESTCFRGIHDGRTDHNGQLSYTEFGEYHLKGTGEWTEWVPEYELIDDANRRAYEQQNERHASLTVGERNPGLADI